MRVAVRATEHGVRLEERPDPVPRGDQRVLRVEAAYGGESLDDVVCGERGTGPIGRRAVGWLAAEGGERRVLVGSRARSPPR